MAKITKAVDLPSICQVNKSQGKIALQLIQALRIAVQQGDLKAGDALPSSREFAQKLQISRGTAVEIYDQLLAEGVIYCKPRIGTFVSDIALNHPPLQAQANETQPLTDKAQAFANVLQDFKPLPHRPFAISVPVNRTQPNDIWLKFTQKYRAQSIPTGYEDPQGILSLRQAIAYYVRRSRAVHCDADQIVICSGIQQSLYICSQILLQAHDQVWLEDPVYLGTSAILQHTIPSLQIVSIPVDDEGIDVEVGIKNAKNAKAAFVTPSHQYPLGMPMSLARRQALLAWAKQHQAWIIEDDYDSELRYIGQPFPALQGLAPEKVIYLGTFSKVLFPSLRLGYAILPKALVEPFCGLRALIDRFPPSREQHVLAEFIQQGYLEK
ncbi:MAG: PLP-dependent aminotransferase family protein, partial [Acinetobacter sp.]